MHTSYCAGQAGIEAALASSAQSLLASASTSRPPNAAWPTEALVHEDKEVKANGGDKETQDVFKKRIGEGDVKIDEAKLAEAMEEERRRRARGAEEEEEGRGKKRKYDGGFAKSYDVTEEELGADALLLFHSSIIWLICSLLQRLTENIVWQVRKTQCSITKTQKWFETAHACNLLSLSPVFLSFKARASMLAFDTAIWFFHSLASSYCLCTLHERVVSAILRKFNLLKPIYLDFSILCCPRRYIQNFQ